MKDMEKKIDDFFNKISMEEEWSRLSRIFTDNFMVQGKATKSLQEVLGRTPESLLDLIMERITGQEDSGDVERKDKEKILYQAIPEYFQKQLLFMDPLKIKLLIEVMNGYPIEPMETATINQEFVPRGWVFTFVENNKCDFVVMDEIGEILRSIGQPDVKSKTEFVWGVRFVVNTCLGLYGVCKREQIRAIYKKALGEDGEKIEKNPDLLQHIDDILPIFEEQKLLWMDGDYIVSPWLETKDDYAELLKKQGGKDYYIPDDNVIQTYAWGNMVEKTPEYETVLKYLTRELADSKLAEEMLEEITLHIAKDDWGIPEIMNAFYDWDVSFKTQKTAQYMTKALCEWLHNVRRWSERGYTRAERKQENEEEKYIAYADDRDNIKISSKKIYPNEPCPCGSGKKYKKCCGK